MTAHHNAAGPAERPDDAALLRYAASKAGLIAELDGYLAAVIEIGNGDPSSSLELARVTLIHDVNAAVARRLFAVPLSGVWAAMVHPDARTGNPDRG